MKYRGENRALSNEYVNKVKLKFFIITCQPFTSSSSLSGKGSTRATISVRTRAVALHSVRAVSLFGLSVSLLGK